MLSTRSNTMMSCTRTSLMLVTSLLLMIQSNLHPVSSFTILSPSTSPFTTVGRSNNVFQFELYGRKVKKGKLSQNVSRTAATTTTTTTKNRTKNNKKEKEATISSSLSQWAATQQSSSQDTSSSSSPSDDTNTDNVSYATFEPDNTTTKSKSKSKNKSNTKSTRRERSTKRQSSSSTQEIKISSAQKQEIENKLESIKEIIQSNNFDVSQLLSLLSSLVSLQQSSSSSSAEGEGAGGMQGASLKQLFLGKNKSYDYNLAWVGSDDAICHVGTGLHKVPLARLQDIFITLSSGIGGGAGAGSEGKKGGTDLIIPAGLRKKNKKKGMSVITVMEVIRILGPFPNVRNTLQGSMMSMNSASSSGNRGGIGNNKTSSIKDMNTSSMSRSSSVGQKVKITYDSMMDGLGKEIKAANDGDVRTLDLDLLYVDANAIVAAVPTDSDDGSMESIYGTNGKNVLLFLREEDIDASLEGLRAS